jgi:hypothetical protein
MNTIQRPCSLERALAYDNEDVVRRFMSQYDISWNDADDVFQETKKWLWIVSQPDAPDMAIVDGMLIIDEMWHNFVLFTREYSQYCLERFGRYIHHLPATHQEKLDYKERFVRDPIGAQQEDMDGFRRRCAFIQERLGTSTLLKWFVEYPEKYDGSFLNERRRPVPVAYTPSTELKQLAERINLGRVLVA